ncbi:hypothetical protein IAT38_003285 [Cryptococcus sp. DSM 104549]
MQDTSVDTSTNHHLDLERLPEDVLDIIMSFLPCPHLLPRVSTTLYVTCSSLLRRNVKVYVSGVSSKVRGDACCPAGRGIPLQTVLSPNALFADGQGQGKTPTASRLSCWLSHVSEMTVMFADPEGRTRLNRQQSQQLASSTVDAACLAIARAWKGGWRLLDGATVKIVWVGDWKEEGVYEGAERFTGASLLTDAFRGRTYARYIETCTGVPVASAGGRLLRDIIYPALLPPSPHRPVLRHRLPPPGVIPPAILAHISGSGCLNIVEPQGYFYADCEQQVACLVRGAVWAWQEMDRGQTVEEEEEDDEEDEDESKVEEKTAKHDGVTEAREAPRRTSWQFIIAVSQQSLHLVHQRRAEQEGGGGEEAEATKVDVEKELQQISNRVWSLLRSGRPIPPHLLRRVGITFKNAGRVGVRPPRLELLTNPPLSFDMSDTEDSDVSDALFTVRGWTDSEGEGEE